jgi:hypothetical protein
VRICTIIAKNYVSQARVLAESFRAATPGGECSVLVIDEVDGYLDASREPFELIRPADLDLPEFELMAGWYDVLELSTAVKPWLLRHLLDRGEQTVTYLDPDIQVFRSLEPVAELAAASDLVLIPHNLEPLPDDGRKPSQDDILLAGAFNLGFASVGAGDGSRRLLDWWCDRLRTQCVVDPDRGLFVDQRWMDLAPGLVPRLEVLRDPGYDLAYWNLPGRNLTGSGGDYTVDGSPLRFFHFSGFDPSRPDRLSKHQDRIVVDSEPVLRELCEGYAAAMSERGWEESSGWPYDWDHLPDGTPLDRYARYALRSAVDSGALSRSIFEPDGARQFLEHLESPARNGDAEPHDAELNHYLTSMYECRPDLQHAFPDLRADAGRMLEWVRMRDGQTPLLERMLGGRSNGSGGGGTASAGAQDAPRRTFGVNVAGYLSGELGVGEAARQVIPALESQGIPLARLGVPVDTSRMGHEFDHLSPSRENAPFSVNLVCVNADKLGSFAADAGPGYFEGAYNIGLWFWELSMFPERYASAFEHLDEVWAASHHVAEAIAGIAPIPVLAMTLPVAPQPPADVDRSRLGLPDGFTFLFVFDHNSVFERKNPLGLIEAFSLAFPPGSGPSLAIKTINGDRHPADRKRLRDAVAGHPDVHLLEDYVDVATKNAMIASCDCYVSLHRSEGFGLSLAEAMYFGRPTIATRYSGNLDFMTERNSYLVDCELRPVGPGHEPYPPDAEWAEPELDQAAALMRRVVDDPAAAAERGRRAAAEIRRDRSPQRAGEQMLRRLELVRRFRVAGSHQGSAAPQLIGPLPHNLDEARLLTAVEEPTPKAGEGRLRRAAKRLMFTLGRPFIAHQRRVDRALYGAIADLERTLARIDRDHLASEAELWRRIEELERKRRDQPR